jgi:uncharacterized protein
LHDGIGAEERSAMSDPKHSPTAAELVRTFVTILSGPHPGQILQLFAEDSWIHTTGTSMLSGKRRPRELMGLLGALSKTIPDGLKLHIENLVGDGNQAACEVKGEATTAEGKPYNNHYVFWVRAEQGKIVQLSEFMDTLLVNEVFAAAAPR